MDPRRDGMSLSVREMRTAVDEVLTAMSPLVGESDEIRAAAFARLLDRRLESVDDVQSSAGSPERINPWSGRAWTPDERCLDLARRWEIEGGSVRAIVDVESDEPWLRLPAAALSDDGDEAIRELTLLLVSARVDSLFNTDIGQITSLVAQYGLPTKRVVAVLKSMDQREILLTETEVCSSTDIYMQPAGSKRVRSIARRLTCPARE